ncbi:MAG TPA: methionine adenosyltransferase [Oligoflexia bacterium]|nr:methionine adenosyltransferase [Oligoflexia bacterium]HMP26633.1 methionine adenosyltransferase [Oligoflexia bacterium]
MASEFIFSSESVASGHPDKICDQISDAILDHCLKNDSSSRVACEALVKNNRLILAGEISSNAEYKLEEIARQVIRDIGYNHENLGFSADSCEILSLISRQSPDISIGVTKGEGKFKEQGAGDQGIMFGFACDQSEELMPLPISLAHKLASGLEKLRRSPVGSFLRPDGKTQVSLKYSDGVPKSADAIVVSTQHTEEMDLEKLEEFIIEELIKKIVPANLLTATTRFFVNPTGRFVLGGPACDCGLTGRKIIVDTYGGFSRHGGGAFSGKDATKVDRSAAYMMRYVAKHIVAAGLAKACELQVAYAIGVAKPVSIFIDTFGTETKPLGFIISAIKELFDFTPEGIMNELKLNRPIFQETATYGHFGRVPLATGHFAWEDLKRLDELRDKIG